MMVYHKDKTVTVLTGILSIGFGLFALKGLIQMQFETFSKSKGMVVTSCHEHPVTFWILFVLFAGASAFLAFWTIKNIAHFKDQE